jgi:pyrimidine operon attenuation protein/uracil phosphoribosyltransferase
MQERLLLDSAKLNITITRLCKQIIENFSDLSELIILGLQPRGVVLANRIHKEIENETGIKSPLGYLDITFYRDDFRRRGEPIKANKTKVPFLLEGKDVILVDDVLYTGRTVRAALDAMNTFGRPKMVELLVLIDRLYSRHLPIEAKYVGRKVNAMESQHVDVQLSDEGVEDQIILVNK